MKIVRAYISGVTLALLLPLAAGAAIHVAPKPKATPVIQASYQPEAYTEGQSSMFGKVISRLMNGKRLSDEDAARYGHIFAFQDIGEFDNADHEIGKLKDRRLMGYVLSQRYLSKSYKASYAELALWMKTYADLPQAQNVYDLALRKRPKGDTAALKAPRTSRGLISQYDADVGQIVPPGPMQTKFSPRAKDYIHAIDNDLAHGRPSAAWKRLNSAEGKKLFNDGEFDSLRADIAGAYFYDGSHDKAFDLAAASAQRSGKDVPLAGWIAGLSAWKQQNYGRAAGYFERTAKSPRASAWMASGSAYWAARSHIRAQEPSEVNAWLKQAAKYPRTFYGIIALKALGKEQDGFNWDMPRLSDAHIRALSKTEAGRRAVALVDAERPDLAEAELSRINPGDDEDLQEAMIAIAGQKGMPGLSMRIGSLFHRDGGELYDAALYPDAPWAPEKGFDVDRALVYAFIRQESNFNPSATNRSSGAQGLMQLMPSTAKHVASAMGDAGDGDKLHDPTVNIDLGQKYIGQLLAHPQVENNLFKLAVAYNAGPGKLARWQQAMANAHDIAKDDPLMFIEAIPAAETRTFVERVLTNYWIYRLKFNQSASSLDDVAEGDWPTYIAQDKSYARSLADAAAIFSR